LGAAQYYLPDVLSFSDYYPFGMQMPGRNGGEDYRYAFNGMEQDPEVSGDGNSYTTEYRHYDSRLGRWKSLDPRAEKYANLSSYSAYANNPLSFTDTGGDTLVYENATTAFGWQVQSDLNKIYKSKLGRGLIRNLQASTVDIEISDATPFYSAILSDELIVLSSETSIKGGGHRVRTDFNAVKVEYAGNSNVFIGKYEGGKGVLAHTWVVLLHELVHARDIASGYFDNLTERAKSGEITILQNLKSIAETRALIVENAYRKEMGIDEVRTHHSGVRLLEDDGVTPSLEFGFDISEGLSPGQANGKLEKKARVGSGASTVIPN
jgi:RHS repeat-associated protein